MQAGSALPQDLSGEVLALEDNAVRAGLALACNYSTSQEYEAELIAVRRAAGAYGPRRGRWPVRLAGIAAGIAVIAVLVLIVK